MSVHTEPGSYRYHAYLSYSHRDEKWAKWLHRKLEAYRTPRHLVGRKTATGIIPKRIAPIFRDRDELPTAVDLGETVTKALRASKNLIVICSPHAAASRWVNEEILTFKRQGRAERVFCFIVAGEPSVAMGAERAADDCFPAALRFQLGEDGNLTDQLSEPVAADARKKKDGKLDARLKLIAGLIGVGFDELKRRELHHRHYRMVAVTSMALAVMVITSVLAWRAIVAEQEALENRAKAEDLISFILGDLRERLAPIGRLEDLNVVGDEAIAYFDSLDEKDLTPKALTGRSKALRQIGEVRRAQGHLDTAMNAFRRSFSDAELLLQTEPGSAEVKFLLAQSTFWIGLVHMEQGDLERATERFRDYLDIAKAMVEQDPNDNVWLLELAYAYSNLGSVYRLRGETAYALENFRGDQTIVKTLVERNPDDLDLLLELAEATSWIGTALEMLGDLEGALVQFGDEIAIKKRLVSADPQDTRLRRLLSLAHRRNGEILYAMGRLDAAEDSVLAALAISEELALLDPSNAEWQWTVAFQRSDLARLELAFDRPAEALRNLQATIKTAEALLTKGNNQKRWQMGLANGRILSAMAFKATGDLESARSATTKAIDYLSTRQSDNKNDRTVTRLLSKAHLLDGQLIALNGSDVQAAEAWRRSLETIEPLVTDTRNFRILSIQAQALLHLDQLDEARLVVQQLGEIGFADSTFIELCDSKGLTASLAQ